MVKDGYIALIGLGAIGSPLAHLLYKKYKERFILIASDEIAFELNKQTIYINGSTFSPKIYTPNDTPDRPIEVLFVCVKNYSLQGASKTISSLIDNNTLILPLQNGVYAYHFFREMYPNNIVLEGFAQGPNTRIYENNIVYQNPGVYHLGKHSIDLRLHADMVYSLIKDANIPCVLDNNIRHAIWQKMMLNVAGNAVTALTGLDYCMFKNSVEAQDLCRAVMEEYRKIAGQEGIEISGQDIDEVIHYFVSYNESKHTSMLEDVIHHRQTENEYIAGYIYRLALTNHISAPYIHVLYSLMKIKENVYLGKLN